MRIAALLCALLLPASGWAQVDVRADQFTPMTASTLTRDARPFPGTDGKTHIAYELQLTNASATPVTLNRIVVVDGDNPSSEMASFRDKDIATRLRTPGAARVESNVMAPGESRLFLIDFSLASGTVTPARLMHRFEILGAPIPSRKPDIAVAQSYTVAPIAINKVLPKISSPLAGDHWVAINGCCDDVGVHRQTSLACDGALYFSQRFAIDWMKLDSEGRFVAGDPSKVEDYADYGVDVLAVADGTVVSTLNSLEDQKPGTLPDPHTINMQNVDGNHIVIDLGDGVYAFYAHLQKGSVMVKPGDRVKRGQVLAKLGNTGNTSAPHLHFHLMEGASVLCSNGIPYTLDSFTYEGEIPMTDYVASTTIEGKWNKGMLPSPSERTAQYPMNLDIVGFPAGH
jgi:hypothetical protein